MRRRASAVIAALLSGVMMPSVAQEPKPNCAVRDAEPPGEDLYVPYLALRGATNVQEMENVEQVKLLAEMNKLTVELVKRRSNRNLAQADTPQLVKKLKDLAKKLREMP